MAYTRQIINVGTTADDGSGDYLRDALIKANQNFESLWQVGAVDSNLDISGSTIAGTVTNEDIILDPSGTGKIVVKSSIEPDTTATQSLGSSSKEFTNVYSDLLTTDALVLNPLTSDPSSPADGYLYYNTSTDKFVGRVNGGWLNFQTVAVGSDNKWTTFNAESGSTTTNSTTDTLTVVGGTGISTSISGDTLTINNTSNPQSVTFNVVDDGSNAGTISNGEDLKIAGGTGITTSMSGDTLTITNSSPGTVTASSTTAFTNKSGNISQWTNDSGYGSMTSWTVVDDGSNAGTISNGEDLKIAGGTNVTTSLAGDTLTINSSVPAQTFASLTGKPTTIAGYGITDAVTLEGDDSTASAVTKVYGDGTISTTTSGGILRINTSAIPLATLKATVAASADFADFKSRIAAL